jgi:transposase
MEKIEIRAVIKFFFIKGLKGREIYGELESTLGTDAVSYATVKNWVAEFKRGRSSTEDEARSGRPADGKSEENIDAVQDMILADRRNTISKIAETLRLSEATTFRIVTEELGYKKVCSLGTSNVNTRKQT